jgi:hypothetical protein
VTQKKRRATPGESGPLLKGRTEQPLSSTQEIATQGRRRTARIVQGATSELAIFDGRDCCGFVRPSGNGFLLLTADRRTVGVFSSLREALAAIGGAS